MLQTRDMLQQLFAYLEDFVEDVDVKDARNETGTEALDFVWTWKKKPEFQNSFISR